MDAVARIPALLVLIAALAGCVGWPSSVDESGLTLQQAGGYCVGGFSNVKDIEAPSKVFINVRPAKDKLNGTILLDLNILVPRGVAVRLRPPEVRLQSPEWPEDKHLPVHHFLGRGGIVRPPDAVLEGITADIPDSYTPWYFPTTETELPQTGIRQAREFTLKLPVFEINGQDFQPDPIRFTSYRKMGWFRCVQ